MKIIKKEIPISTETMKAEINVLDKGKIYIVQDDKVIMLPLPEFGVIEIPCQNYKVGNPSYRITTKL